MDISCSTTTEQLRMRAGGLYYFFTSFYDFKSSLQLKLMGATCLLSILVTEDNPIPHTVAPTVGLIVK